MSLTDHLDMLANIDTTLVLVCAFACNLSMGSKLLLSSNNLTRNVDSDESKVKELYFMHIASTSFTRTNLEEHVNFVFYLVNSRSDILPGYHLTAITTMTDRTPHVSTDWYFILICHCNG